VSVRLVRVPLAVAEHDAHNSRKMPFREFVALNAGIVRARGEWVLVTNADVLLSNELVTFCMAPRTLDAQAVYRAVSFGVDMHEQSYPATRERMYEQLVAKKEVKYLVALMLAEGGAPSYNDSLAELYDKMLVWRAPLPLPPQYDYWGYAGVFADVCAQKSHKMQGIDAVRRLPPTHAARQALLDNVGDFVLAPRRAWRQVRGFDEDSWSVAVEDDALHLLGSAITGLQQVVLLPPCGVLHMEHRVESRDGWRDQRRLRDASRRCFEDAMQCADARRMLNDADTWGLQQFEAAARGAAPHDGVQCSELRLRQC